MAPILMPTMPPRRCATRHPPQGAIRALRIKAQPIDHRRIGVKAKDPRPRIARLRQRRDGADFNETETQAQQRVRHLGVFVESRRHPYRIGEIEAEGAHREAWMVFAGARQRRKFKHGDGEPMRVLRIERRQQRPREMF